jgi:hypothetical protein
VLNSGYERVSSNVRRGVGKQRRKYETFAPIALAAIGTLTLPLMSRSVVIPMTRHDGSTPLRRFDLADTDDLDIAYRHIFMWARTATLNHDPEMPDGLHGRKADPWRPLIAIADACSPAWGALAREAAIHFVHSHCYEDISITTLRGLRDVYDTRHVDRSISKDLVAALNEQDDGIWAEWRGVKGDQNPRRLSQGELAKVLAPFGIKSRSIRLQGKGSTAKGYYRHQFEQTWASYCPTDGTTAQPSNVRQLYPR